MAEMRLIDANALLSYMSDMEVQSGKKCCASAIKSCIDEFFPQVIADQPTIDPETLPIARELREKLERVTAERNTALKWVKQLKAEKAAAIGELSGVLASVDALTEFVDDEVHPVVDYDLYLRLRDNVDVITQWEHADEWA